MEPKFQVGEKVKRKAGGPVMTVVENRLHKKVEPGLVISFLFTGTYKCCWLDSDGTVKRDYPSEESLEAVG